MQSLWPFVGTLFLVACSGRGELLVLPPTLEWGEVDFQEILPDEGYAAVDLALQNTGKTDLELRFVGFDDTHLRLGAALVDDAPPALAPLAPGGRVVVTVGVWSYQAGERDTLVDGSFQLSADSLRDPVEVPWSFTPVRHIVDTGT